MQLQQESASHCSTCRCEIDADAAFCDPCGWPVQRSRSTPRFRRSLGPLALLSAMLVLFIAMPDWSEVSRGLAISRAERGVAAALVRKAEEQPLTYLQAHAAPRVFDGRLVLWHITPANSGYAFHRGDFTRRMRLLNPLPWPHEGLGGKSTESLQILARIKWDGKPGLAVEVLGVF